MLVLVFSKPRAVSLYDSGMSHGFERKILLAKRQVSGLNPESEASRGVSARASKSLACPSLGLT